MTTSHARAHGQHSINTSPHHVRNVRRTQSSHSFADDFMNGNTPPMIVPSSCISTFVLGILYLSTLLSVLAFVPATITRTPFSRCFMVDTEKPPPKPISDMRVAEIRDELKDLKIDFSDCFDKESLVLRLQDARTGKVVASPPDAVKAAATETDTNFRVETPVELPKEIEERVRAMSVKELRQELAQRQIRWAGLLEKKDLVQAVLDARKQAATFSVTGKLTPGHVGDLTGAEVEQEWTGGSTPMLLDVYATWCGPCQLVSREIVKVAEAFGDRLRVAKMDSDKHVDVSSKLHVQGLPSFFLFQNGKEVDRIEGALMKDQIIQWVESKIST